MTDWSKEGVGFFLLQKHCCCDAELPNCCPDGWRLTFAGSRVAALPTWWISRYALIEGEVLAIAYALEKVWYFVLGYDNLVVATDHKPLVSLFSDRSLDNICNTCLFNLKEATLCYRFRIAHIPGRKHIASDAASHHPTGPLILDKMYLPNDVATLLDGYSMTDLWRNILDGIR